MKNEMRICKDCSIEFSKKSTNKGLINQCDECSEIDPTEIYLGFNDGSLNKATHISVYRGSDPRARKMISTQKARTGI